MGCGSITLYRFSLPASHEISGRLAALGAHAATGGRAHRPSGAVGATEPDAVNAAFIAGSRLTLAN